MARENKLKGIRRAATEVSSVAAMENYISQNIDEYNIKFDYSLLKELEENDIKSLKNYEQALLFEGKKLGTVALEIGKNLVRAREIFIKSHSESFVAWYEALGLSKDQVTVFTSRYKLSLEYPEQKEKILSLSDRIIRETINKKNPNYIMEKVFSGELKTALEIKKERENNSIMIEKKSEIEEAEIIEKYIPYSSFEKLFVEINLKFVEFKEKYIENGSTKENFEILEKIHNLANKLK